MFPTRFEPDHLVNYTKACSITLLVHAYAVSGKLMTLTNFLLHFKPKCLRLSAARFEPT